jgi:Fic family protein
MAKNTDSKVDLKSIKSTDAKDSKTTNVIKEVIVKMALPNYKDAPEPLDTYIILKAEDRFSALIS